VQPTARVNRRGDARFLLANGDVANGDVNMPAAAATGGAAGANGGAVEDEAATVFIGCDWGCYVRR
jgi:hypothetical protein